VLRREVIGMRIRKFFLALGLGILGFVSGQMASGQEKAPATPSSETLPPGVTATETPVIASEGSSPENPVNPYIGDLFTRQRLTGDWWGTRSALADRGVTFDLFATQFYQGIARGGDQTGFPYGGKLDYLLNVDGGKLGAWKGLFLNMHAETRYGRSTNEIDGLIAPSNIPLNFPEEDTNITSITGLKITQALSENFAIYLGKINTLDEYPLRYSPGLGNNRPGLEGFMNTSLVFNPIVARTVPYSTAAVGAAILSKEGEPIFTFTVFDPEERSTKSMNALYERGVVLMPDLVLRGKPFGKPATLNIGGSWSNAEYRSLDPAAYLNILGQVLDDNREEIANSPVKKGSWSIYANLYQSLWVDELDEKRNWGVFGQFGFSDGDPNPIRYVINGGIGGRSMIPGRNLDTFGVGYFYLGLSDDFKSVTRSFHPQQDEYGLELFYNVAITPWARLTPDVQIVRPSTAGLKTTVIPGLRFQMLF
jgi:porin